MLVGLSIGLRRERVTVVHVEAREAVVAPPAGEAVAVGGGVFLVHEDAGDAAGAAAQVFVAAPDRLFSPVSTGRHPPPQHPAQHRGRRERERTYKINPPLVQIQRDIARRMGQVPAHHDALGLGVLRDGFDVERLPRVELHARQEQQRRVVGVAVNDLADLLRRQHGALGLGEDCDQRIGGVEAVPADLRLDCVLHHHTLVLTAALPPIPPPPPTTRVRGSYMVTRECLPLNDNLPPALARAVGAVEAGEEVVDVVCERAHDGDLCGQRADDVGHVARHLLVGADPWARERVLEVALDAARGPDGELLVEQGAGCFGLQAERVAAEVDAGVCGVCGVVGLVMQLIN